ncbi:MAG: hypothetical protein ACI8UR_000400 [Natronomonas sp.]|jgi:hypothetical protein
MRMERYLMVEPEGVCMSAEQREPLGMQHLTVVPENFEPPAEGEESDDS